VQVGRLNGWRDILHLTAAAAWRRVREKKRVISRQVSSPFSRADGLPSFDEPLGTIGAISHNVA
jgi:hypothetical protein